MTTTSTPRTTGNGVLSEAQPRMHQRGHIIQTPDSVRSMPIGLDEQTRLANVAGLNQVLVDTITLFNLYKKHHWQVSGHTFYQLHLLFDKHAGEQFELIDLLAERVQTLGGVAIGMPHEVAEMTTIARAPQGVEEVPAMLSRLLEAHEVLIAETRSLAQKANDNLDLGTNDLLVSDVLRTNELQVWFLSAHLADTPATITHSQDGGRSN